MNRRIVLAHPFGNANVRQALLAFHGAEKLEKFITTVSADNFAMRSFLPGNIKAEIDRRSFSPLPELYIESHPYHEILRLLGKRAGRISPRLARFFPTVDDVWASTDNFLYANVHKRDDNDLIVYAYEDGAYKTFSALTRSRKVYELPIGYWKSMHSILEEEREINPEWAVTLAGLGDPQEKLNRKDRELELADQIIVPSRFVASTLPSVHQAKITTIPYGCPTPLLNENQVSHSANGALKVFFCGSLGQRKGISYLFDAIEKMGSSIDVTVVGSIVAPCPALNRALNRVKWHRSLPNQQVLELMRRSDVFVFPSLFEGRALVVLEALAQGIPVITTVNSGTEDVVIDGESGFLIPVRSSEAICNALEHLHLNRDLLFHMKLKALQIARQSGWEKYRKKLVETVN